MREVVLAVLFVLTLAACGGANSIEAGSSSSQDRRWGPLAVSSSNVSGAEARLEGTLQITDECISLQDQGKDVLLVWGAGQVIWNASERTIAIKNAEGTVILAHGDHIRLSGGGSSVDEGGGEAEEWVESIDWISQPAQSCVTEARWFVGNVEKLP